ncbi:M56 family metallopeptidase [Mucilaginibacter mali]|uniref:M56 family metallopeptidase n=1 Tax=Mucilaginibacter mali TaxID=2740462 RepID=A0A7D4TV05_9SPHI|nr:M56 family metallopeptidase [Mucilaginibacter mali]QKJ30135.1 M56 family metallopeptidase [Mucilaginibacter mali]
MDSIIYLLQVCACTAVFYLFYYLFLTRLTFFVINRWYLLVTVVLSFIIPLIKIQLSQPHVYTGVVEHVVYQYTQQPEQVTPIVIHPDVPKPQPMRWSTILQYTYLLAVIGLNIHLLATLFAFFKRLKGKRITKVGKVNILTGNEKITNGSFLNYIFLNDDELSPDEIRQIIAHEMLHVKLYHSVDRIIVKIAQIILWFNPFIYLYARSVEENHEFEVDRAVARETDKHNYANLLVHLSVAGQGMLYHNFSKVPLKKRITMLFNQPSANMKKIVYVLVVPVVLISCLAFARLKSKDKEYSVIENIDELGKDPLVIIDGKTYKKDILYKISKNCIASSGIWNPDATVVKHGVAIKDGYVDIKTNKGVITYMNALEKENLLKERLIPEKQFYSRIHLKNDDGTTYDKVIVNVYGAGKVSTMLKPGEKAGFLIDKKFYNEDEIQKADKSVTMYLSAFYSVGPAGSFPDAPQKGYASVFNFKSLPPKAKTSIEAFKEKNKAYISSDEYKRKLKLTSEMNGKTLDVVINGVVNNQFIKTRTDRVSFELDGDKYGMKFYYGQGLETNEPLKVGDRIQVLVKYADFQRDSIFIIQAAIYKDGKVIFKHHGGDGPTYINKPKENNDNTNKVRYPEKDEAQNSRAAYPDDDRTNKEKIAGLFIRNEVKKSNGEIYDEVVSYSRGGMATTDIKHNGKVGFYIDRDFYSEEAFNKVSDNIKLVLANKGSVGVCDGTDFSSIRKRGYTANMDGYEAVFFFSYKMDLVNIFDSQKDTIRKNGIDLKLKAKLKNMHLSPGEVAYMKTDDYKTKKKLSDDIYHAGTIDIKITPEKNKTGMVFTWNGHKYTLLTFYGQEKILNKLLKPGDEIQLKVFSTGWGKDQTIVTVVPASVSKNNEKIFQLAEADKLPTAPFLYEPNKVRYADGQISDIKKYPNGKWKSALFETVNGYKFYLTFKPNAPAMKDIQWGDHVRLRFVHEVSNGNKTFNIADWVSISPGESGYGIRNPELFDKYYVDAKATTVNTQAKQENKTAALPNKSDLLKLNLQAADSLCEDEKRQIIRLYNASVSAGDFKLEAAYVLVDKKNHLLYASGRIDPKTKSYTGIPSVKTIKGDNAFYTDSIVYNWETQKSKAWVWGQRGTIKSTLSR